MRKKQVVFVFVFCVVALGQVSGTVLPAQADCSTGLDAFPWLDQGALGPAGQDAEALATYSLVDTDGEVLGEVRFNVRDGGCSIVESWSAAGHSGTALFAFDPESASWRLLRGDSRGHVAQLVGQADADGRDGLLFEGEFWQAASEPYRLRWRITTGDDGQLVQQVQEAAPEASDFGPVQELHLVEVEQEGASAAELAQSLDVGPSGSVRTISRQAQREQLALEDRQQIPLASPMVLEVESGAIHQFPEGAAWRTDAPAEFVSNRVTIRELSVGKSEKRGKVFLTVSIRAYTTRRSARIKAQVAVVSQGTVVLESALEEVKIGLSVPAYDPDEGLERDFRFEVDSEAFASWFEGERRPLIRLTVETPAL